MGGECEGRGLEVGEARVTETCGDCGRTLKAGWSFALRTPQGLVHKCLKDAVLHWPMLLRSLKVAVVVGTILTLLNQGDTLFTGEWKPAFYWKVPLTYLTPFLVATVGALLNSRS